MDSDFIYGRVRVDINEHPTRAQFELALEREFSFARTDMLRLFEQMIADRELREKLRNR